MKTGKPLVYSLALTTAFLWNGGQIFGQRQSNGESHRLPAAETERVDGATQFLKLVKDDSGTPQSLQTSITRFRSPDRKLLIDLIAVIHVGEKAYYKKLDHQFTQYDALLYELVAPAGKQVPIRSQSSGFSANPLRLIQGTMQNMLGLHSQLDHIDYTKKNFVHADLTPAQIKAKLQQRGETPWTFAFKALGEAMQQEMSATDNQTNDIQSFEQLISTMSDTTRLKRVLASQFTSGDAMELGLGQSMNQLLITDRNEAAVKVLKREIGKGSTRLALFYGAAHMPDFEERLTGELGMKKTRQAWVEAWDLSASENASTTNSPINSLTDMLFQLLDEASK